MQMMKAGIPALALWAAMTVQAGAEVITLTPADPQPDPATLTEGLAVKYAYPPEVKSLRDAEHWLENAEPGEPLSGLKYIDTAEGEMTLTSTQATRVAAEITGFVHFSRPGRTRLISIPMMACRPGSVARKSRNMMVVTRASLPDFRMSIRRRLAGMS